MRCARPPGWHDKSMKATTATIPDGPAALPLPAGVSHAEFRTAMRQVASSVAVVTGMDGDARNGLTATSVCPVAVTPPTLLVCVNEEASALPLITASGAFAVNFLSEDQHPLARLFSTAKLGADARFAHGRWHALETGAPVLDGAVASFDCRLEECIRYASHSLLLGRVVATAILGESGLLYRDGLFRRLAPVT